MQRDNERLTGITAALRDADLNALICTLPENVLVLSGYWPVVGTSVAVATAAGRIAVLVPKDEQDLAEGGWADEVRTYEPGSLERLVGPEESIQAPLESLLLELGAAHGTLGYEDVPVYEGAPYAAMYVAGLSIRSVLSRAVPGSSLVTGASAISHLRSRLTSQEVDRVRLACRIAGEAFRSAAGCLRPGIREPAVAAAFAEPMVVRGFAHEGVARTNAFTWCMSGPNSARAGAAYARTRNRALGTGDLVLVHCNSYIDGYWTDITRTFCLGRPDDRQRSMYDAIFAAREAALGAIQPGAGAAAVDGAARDVLRERGFGEYFTHGIGHNVGFSVISAEFPPRLHPASPDRLESGMTFNIEPAIYIEGYGGIRHCDVVTVHSDGPEVLTPFQAGTDELIVAPAS